MRAWVKISLLLACLSCHGQPIPLLSGSVAIQNPSSTSLSASNFMVGLAYAWEFTNSSVIPTNTAITNWIDNIQGYVLTNGDSTTRPTNSTIGVGFNGSTFLTNILLNIGTNWVVTIRHQWTGSASDLSSANWNGGAILSDTVQNGGAFGWIGLHGNNGGTTRAYRWITSAGALGGSNPDLQQTPEGTGYFVDYTLINSNSAANGNGGGHCYTNSQLYQDSTGSGNDYIANTFQFRIVSPFDNVRLWHFKGYIQAIYIQTGTVATVQNQSVNASNIHYWTTNYLVHGASP